jgi:hypothetical protein
MSSPAPFMQPAPAAPAPEAPRAGSAPAPFMPPAASPGTLAVPQTVITAPKPAPSGVGDVANSMAAVKQMQQAILNFSKALAASPLGKQTGPQESTSGQYLGGTDPFGAFLVQHYMQNVAQPGKQVVTPTDMKMPQREQTATPQNLFRGVVNTIAMVGTPSAPGAPRTEARPDGIWGWRTQNALLSIYEVCRSMVYFMGDLKVKANVNVEKEFENFTNTIQEALMAPHSANQGQKRYAVGKEAELSAALTKDIKFFTELAQQFKQLVLENKEYRGYIDQTKSFGKYETTESGLTKEEQEILQKNMNTVIPGLEPLMFKDIATPEGFKAYLQRTNIDPGSQQAHQILDAYKKRFSPSTAAPGPGY